MILVDSVEEEKNKKMGSPIAPLLRAMGLQVEMTPLEYGDFCFEGIGHEGPIYIGVERKRLHDMLNCIDDARYTGHQRIGMSHLYTISVLLVEGLWRPHDEHGTLMEGFIDKSRQLSWAECRYRSQRTMYSKLRRYLYSVSLAGVIVCYTRDSRHTAYDLHELYHYHQKRDHRAMLGIYRPSIPTLNRKPSLVRRWAYDLEGVGLEKSELAERLFRKPITLANADETEWLRLPGIGVKSAQSIVREIWGVR